MNAYFRLMRFDKPIGTLLLWIPTAWALWLANGGLPPISLLIYFLVGTFLMRSAGCVVNDMADRNIDKHVKRTHLRPLANEELSLTKALLLLSTLLLGAFIIVMQLPRICLYYSFVALGITIIYPFCKRFIQAPQLVLGFAFSMGIPMAYAASHALINSTMFVLILLNLVWVIAYDTMYAMADREEDLRIGVKSTAILFGKYDRVIILLLQCFVHSTWLYLAIRLNFSYGFFMGWGIGLLILCYQQFLVSSRKAEACFSAFLINGWYGLIMWLALILS